MAIFKATKGNISKELKKTSALVQKVIHPWCKDRSVKENEHFWMYLGSPCVGTAILVKSGEGWAPCASPALPEGRRTDLIVGN